MVSGCVQVQAGSVTLVAAAAEAANKGNDSSRRRGAKGIGGSAGWAATLADGPLTKRKRRAGRAGGRPSIFGCGSRARLGIIVDLRPRPLLAIPDSHRMSNARDPFVEFAAGAVVFTEGDSGIDMFIIESGQVDIVRKTRGEEPVATLGPGDFFGEMA